MIIEKLEIKNFGKLKERKILLNPGINVIYGENESGKSTLHAFIRSMFFGVERMRGKAARMDTYNRCEPWDNPACYAGTMEFSCDGKVFHLERNFYKEKESARLLGMRDGELLSVEQGDLQMLLGGIQERIFDNTVSVGQLKSVTGKELAEELQSYMANYEGGADEEIDPTRAIQNLKEKKKAILQQKKSQQSAWEQQERELQVKMELLRSEQNNCRQKIQEAEQAIQRENKKREGSENPDEMSAAAIREQQDERKRQMASWRAARKIRRFWNRVSVIWAAWALLFLGIGARMHGENTAVICFILACAAGLQVPVSLLIRWWVGRRTEYSHQEEENPSVDSEKLFPASESHTLRENQGKLRQLQEELKERSILLENLQQEQEELKQNRYDRTHLDEELEALELAMEVLKQVMAQMQNNVGARLRIRMGEILGELTNQAYTHVTLGEHMEIQVETLERTVELYQLSRGTLEQVYFALRMAVSEVLCGQESLPVILDEVFAMYDEKRLARALQWLEKHKEQVIIFTCHKREMELLEQLGMKYTGIYLESVIKFMKDE